MQSLVGSRDYFDISVIVKLTCVHRVTRMLVRVVVDLERKISVRTTREELIKRGVLKEVDDNQLQNTQLPPLSGQCSTLMHNFLPYQVSVSL